jgi:tetratricopeptide (TPR) repeat protein
MGNFKEAYNIAKEIHLMKKEHLINRLGTDIKILIQLAKAEQGLGNTKEALDHIDTVTNYLKQDIDDISSTSDKNLADAFVIKGDILNDLSQSNEAVKFYEKAENIYYNRYRQNINNMDEVSYALSQGAKISCANNYKEQFNKFKGHLINYFGKDHIRVKMTQDYCSKFINNF